MNWELILQNFGFAAVACSALGLACWRTALWLSPLIDGLVKDHRELVATLVKEVPRYRENFAQNLEKLERIATSVGGNSNRLDEINSKLAEVCKIKDDLPCAVK